MSPDDFVLALRALDAPVFLDNAGVPSPLGIEFTATTSDGKNVLVTQLSAALNGSVTNPDAFIRALERIGYQGAGLTESGQLYFLELPPRGSSLAQRLASTGPVPASELLQIARAAAGILATAPFVTDPHGTLALSTVHVVGDNAVFLRWPGMLGALRASGVDQATISREMGLIPFTAPELTRGDVITPRADVFALGITLYTALTGRPPFGGRTTATVMAAVLADDGAPVTSVADLLTAVLLRAIEQDPNDRWNDMQQFREALGTSAVGTAVGTWAASPGKTSRGCLGIIAFIALIGLVLLRVSHYIS